MDGNNKVQIDIVANASGVAPAVQETTASLTQIKTATDAVAVATTAEAAALTEAAQVAATYTVSLTTAQRALEILGAAPGTAMSNFEALDAAMDAAQAEAAKAAQAQAAYTAALTASAAATIEAGEAEEKQLAISESLAGALTKLKISQEAVAAAAIEMGISEEVAGRAMVQMAQSGMAAEVAAARAQMEAMIAPTLEVAAAQETVNAAADTGAMKFGRGSPFFHAMVSSVNMARGGTAALRGFFEAIEIASFALPGFIGPLLLLGATVYDVAEQIGKHTEKTKDGKKAADDYKTSLDAVTVSLSEMEKSDAKGYGGFLRDLREATAEIEKQNAGLRELQRAQDELKSAELAKKIAELDNQEAKDSEGKDPDKRSEIHNAYDRKRLDARIAYDKDKAESEVRDKAAAVAEAQDALDANKKEQVANTQDMRNASSTLDQATKTGAVGVKTDAQSVSDRIDQLVAKWGSLDATGEERGLNDKEKIEYQKLTALLPQLQQREKDAGVPQYDIQLKELTEQRDKASDLLKKSTASGDVAGAKEAQQTVDSTTAQIVAINDYTAKIKTASKGWEDSYEQIKKLTSEAALLTKKLQTANTNLETAKLKTDTLGIVQNTQSTALTQKTQQDEDKTRLDESNTNIKRASDALESKLKDPTLTEAQKIEIQREIKANEAAVLGNTAAYNQKFGLVSPEETDAAMTHIRGIVRDADFDQFNARRKAGLNSQPVDPRLMDEAQQTVNQGLDVLNNGQVGQHKIFETISKLPDVLDKLQAIAEKTADSLDPRFQAVYERVSRLEKKVITDTPRG